MRVSPDFFTTLGLGPVIGRTFTEEETTSQTDHVAILSDAFWRQRYNADPNVIGKQIRVNSVPRTVIGVLPPAFRFLSSDARVFLPLASRPEDRTPLRRHYGGNVIQMIARLKPDATLQQAQSQLDAQNAALEVDDPQAKMIADAGFRSLVVSLQADHVAAIRPTLLLLQAGAIALLLIGAVNLVNLLLVRASGRVKELAVRQALGASRGYVVSEVVVETTLLTLAGGLLGLAVGYGGIHLLRVLGADRLPLGSRIAFDMRLALVSLVTAVIMGIVFAAPVAWFNLRRHLGNALQSESRGGTSGRAPQFLRHSFVVSQIALAFMLLAESARGHYSYGVAGDYFRAMGFSLRAGRFLTVDDSRRSERVCVVDEDFARYYWPNASAIGQRLWDGSEAGKDAEAFTVVGVVGGVKQAGLTEDEAQGAIYYPYAFRIDASFFVGARTSLPPESLGLGLQKVVRQIDPDIPVNDLRSMETRIADSLVARRSPALLAGLFSCIALLLTAVGTYGVLSYAVARRRREIGLRMALGAQPGQIRSQFFYLSLRLLAGGTALGFIGAWLTGQAMQAVLFHVPALNLAILAGAMCVMGLVSLAACLLPSHR